MYLIYYKCSKHGGFEVECQDLPEQDHECPKCLEEIAASKEKGFISDVEREKKRAKARISLKGATKTTKKKREQRAKKMYESGKAPAKIGSNITKAVDATAEMVMQDYGMTDINMNSNMREGDNCAPKLDGTRQKMSDAMFGRSKQKTMSVFNIGEGPRVVNVPASQSMAQAPSLGAAAIKGAFATENDPVAMAQAVKPKIRYLNK